MPESQSLQTTKQRGGFREGAGRPLGTFQPHTVERRRANQIFNQRVRKVADKLFVAQSQLALGSMKVIRVDEDDKGKQKYVHVTDTQEIIDLLTEHEGLPGVVDGKYYFFQDVPPDNKALDSMLDRGLGKVPSQVAVTPTEELYEAIAALRELDFVLCPADPTDNSGAIDAEE